MQRIHKLLIANRGEIACRIARTCRRLGIAAATVHSSADAGARHVREIGESLLIESDTPTRAYLEAEAIVDAARRLGADAVHPGYGFLSEQPRFARAVESAGLVFVGPTAETIARVGDKASARREAARLGLPVLEGTDNGSRDVQAIAATVRGTRLPVVLKAVAGGGGRGMAVIDREAGLEARIESAMREAEKAFGDGALIVERYLPKVRHIEVQVAGDGRGRAVHLYERECTLQRRHQKLIEEAPAAKLAPALREAMLADACKLAAAVSYRGLGTVEFIVDERSHYFLEVNPRLQVEHPVTEEVTGLDLVALQLWIADEGRLPLNQQQVSCRGHAIEARICAEDASAGFVPVTGRVALARFPGSPLRVEAGVADGDEVTAWYDSMIAKLIARGDNREQAIARLRGGLRETTIVGLQTNLRFLDALLDLPETRDSSFHTRLIDERFASPAAQPGAGGAPLEALCAAALLWLERQRRGTAELGCWSALERFTGWRFASGADGEVQVPSLLLREGGHEMAVGFGPRAADGSVPLAVGAPAAWRSAGSGQRGGDAAQALADPAAAADPATVADLAATAGRPAHGDAAAMRRLRASLVALGDSRWLLRSGELALEVTLVADGEAIEVASARGSHRFECSPWVGGASVAAAGSGRLTAPMMGKVIAIKAAPGQAVDAGQAVVVLESMKMELHVNAPFDANVRSVNCALGDMVERGALLAEVEASGAQAAAGSPAGGPTP